ncbi:MAG: RdgB/HAM1 family non-canonical purine NTP pyrophosphatase [Xanthomonadales bacterium]|nr:RdgB/HAM1 family non-canonical purine NTP pyrophosphatase [Xanthomonadales bacterium]
MNNSHQWVLATGNAGKVREFQQRLQPVDVELMALSDFTSDAPAETGTTFVENAVIKARAAAAASGLPALADDSGLCVTALGGAPGVYSARYAGDQGSDADNNRKLLEALDGVEQRAARFVCVLAWMRSKDDPLPMIFQGEWHGRIVHRPAGDNGFGYDPLFFVESHGCTSAQLEPEVKNGMSHRGLAIDHLLAWMESM